MNVKLSLFLVICIMLFPLHHDAQTRTGKRWFPAESARWVWMPYLNPSTTFPRFDFHVNDPGLRLGMHALWYSPVRRLAPALKLEIASQGFTHFDGAFTRYMSRDVSILPHINWKIRRPDFRRNTHYSLDMGMGSSIALFREKRTWSNGNTERLFGTTDIRPFRLFALAGIHIDRDVFHADRPNVEKSARVGLHFIDIAVLLPLGALGNYYNNDPAFPYSHWGFYPTITMGQAIDLKRNKANYESEAELDRAFKIPAYFDQAHRKFFAGLFYEVTLQQPINDSLKIENSGGENKIRLSLANSIGASVHFGNYPGRLDKDRAGLSGGRRGGRLGVFASGALNFRQYVNEGTAPWMCRVILLDGYVGLRIEPVAGIFLNGGYWITMPAHRKISLANGDEMPAFFPSSTLRHQWFAGISYRNWIYIRIKPSLLNPYFSENFVEKNGFFQQTEISIGVGF